MGLIKGNVGGVRLADHLLGEYRPQLQNDGTLHYSSVGMEIQAFQPGLRQLMSRSSGAMRATQAPNRSLAPESGRARSYMSARLLTSGAWMRWW